MQADRPWIVTDSGRQVYILEPTPDDIDIDDIAHGLSNLCRFSGQCARYYSVAEHCLHVSYILPEALRLHGLLHDASEAYINDVIHPLKHHTELGTLYRDIESKIDAAIWAHFRLDPPPAGAMKLADGSVLRREMLELKKGSKGMAWKDFTSATYRGAPPADIKLHCWYPDVAKEAFLKRFDELRKS